MLQRRHVLKGLAAATLAPVVTPATRCFASATDRMQLGLVTYNWGKDWDIPTIIENCEQTGFTGVELRSTHRHGVEISLDDAQRADVKARFEDSKVQLVGLGSACEYHSDDPAKLKKNIEETKAFVRLCHDVGGSGVKVRPNGFPKGVPIEKTLQQIGISLREVGEHAEGFGVQIRLEVHGHGTSELPHIKTMMDVADHPNVVLCWNCNPTDMIGEGFEHNFNLVREKIGTIHIHDLRNDAYPWPALFEKLKQLQTPAFTGWTLLEDGKVPKDIVQAMHANKEVWNALVRNS
ncbi:MAG: sugar phosphate isomerase/epimerase family protein [Pirellulaceae bacterium]